MTCPICKGKSEGYPIRHNGECINIYTHDYDQTACKVCWLMRVKELEAEDIDERRELNASDRPGREIIENEWEGKG